MSEPIKIKGIDGLSYADVHEQVGRGGKFVIFSYTVSLLIITLKRNTSITFVPPGESVFMAALPWNVLTLLLGWWGFPFGLIYTPWSLFTNLQGGTDVTQLVLGSLRPAEPSADRLENYR